MQQLHLNETKTSDTLSCEIIMRVSEEKRRLLPDESGLTSDQGAPPAWWGWVVVTASFYCIAILDGVGYTTGVMLDSLLRDLGGGRERSVSWAAFRSHWTHAEVTQRVTLSKLEATRIF